MMNMAVTPATSAIPYRIAPVVPAGSLAAAILVTLVFLCILVLGLVLARRKGWLQAWFGGVAPAKQVDSHFCVTAKLRVSANMYVYTVKCGECHYLLVESSQHVAIHPQVVSQRGDHADQA